MRTTNWRWWQAAFSAPAPPAHRRQGHPAAPRKTRLLVEQLEKRSLLAACDAYYCTTFDDVTVPVYRADFEGAIGPEWSSTATDVTPVGGRRFLGQFGNDIVQLRLPATAFPAGTTEITLALELFVIRTWDGNHDGGGSGPDRLRITLGSGPSLLDTTFSNNHPNSGFAGQAFPGSFGTGQFAPRTGASENNTLGFEFPGVGVMDSVYDLELTFAYTGGDVFFNFAGLLTTPGFDESWGLDNVEVRIQADVPPEFSGSTTTESVQGYAAHGFSGDFLRNDSLPPERTTLTLTGLPEHDAIDLQFLLAVIDSWDGDQKPGQFFAPDIFNVTVDGNPVFSHTLVNSTSTANTQNYVPPPGVELARRQLLGFNGDPTDHRDSAYNLGLDPVFQNIPHTASTLTVAWFASGSGFEGGTNESWAIDNVKVFLVQDDEPPPPPPPPPPPATIQFRAPQYEVLENEPFAVLTVERTGGLDSSARVDFETVSGTAGQPRILAGLGRDEDFTTTSGTLLFRPRQSFATIRVPIRDDAKIEPAETFNVVLSNPSAGSILGASASAHVTIHDNDPSLSFVASSSQRSEGASGRGNIEVRLTPASNQTVTVAFSAVAGTATPGGDFRPASGRLTFRPGETRKFINFVPVNDTLYEPGNEVVIYELSSPVGGFLGSQTRHRITIVDNDPEPPPADPGSTPANSLFIDLQTLPRQSYAQHLRGSDRDVFRVHLQAGERLALDVDPAAVAPALTGVSSSTLTVLKPNGTVLATVGRSAEPDTGALTNNPAHMFQASETGDYYIRLQTTGNALRGYRLWFHRLGVSENIPDPKLLAQSGDMYAWYDGDDTVGITGPTGYGFTLVGPWHQDTTTFRRTALTTQTLTLNSGSRFTLHSPQGVDLPLIANGTISITTKHQRWGDSFGVVDNDAINFRVGIDIAPLNDVLASALGSSFVTVGALAGEWRISLGGDVYNLFGTARDSTDKLDYLLPGIPYLRRFGASGIDVRVAGQQANTSETVPVHLIVDPADPMLFLKSPPDQTSFLDAINLAASLHGLLSYKPTDAADPELDPDLTEFYGHFLISTRLSWKTGRVPVAAEGDLVINIDADRDGRPLGDVHDVDRVFEVLAGDLSEVRDALNDIQLGVNGQLVVSVPRDLAGEALKIEVGPASMVVNGLTETMWMRGKAAAKAFPGSRLELASGSIVMESLQGFEGDFLIVQRVETDILGVQADYEFRISNAGISLAVTTSREWGVSIDVPGGTASGKAKATFTAHVAIQIDDDGDVHLAGSVSARGRLTARIGGNNRELFDGTIEASVRSRGFRFRFPLGVGSLEMNLF